MPRTIKIELFVNLETQDAEEPSDGELYKAIDDLQDAIVNRIFGEGVFADHLVVDEWYTRREIVR